MRYPRIARRALLLAVLLVGAAGPVAGLVPVLPAKAAASVDCAPLSAAGGTPTVPAAILANATAPAVAFPEKGGKLTVFAAASLTDAFNDMKKDLEGAHPGLQITYNFAGSPTLVTQLTQGAQADVFASANEAQMDAAVKQGVIEGKPITFTHNRLAIVVPKGDPAGIKTPADLAKSGLKLVLAAPAVPVGHYARVAICKMGQDAGTYGSGFVAKVNRNVASAGEQDVKAVLAKVELGQADAGIVYTTDVTPDAAKDVTLIPIPADVNVVAIYPIAPVKGGNAALAAAFISYVVGPQGQATLGKYGFESKP